MYLEAKDSFRSFGSSTHFERHSDNILQPITHHINIVLGLKFLLLYTQLTMKIVSKPTKKKKY